MYIIILLNAYILDELWCFTTDEIDTFELCVDPKDTCKVRKQIYIGQVIEQ